jgi:hypothetical protein
MSEIKPGIGHFDVVAGASRFIFDVVVGASRFIAVTVCPN